MPQQPVLVAHPPREERAITSGGRGGSTSPCSTPVRRTLGVNADVEDNLNSPNRTSPVGMQPCTPASSVSKRQGAPRRGQSHFIEGTLSPTADNAPLQLSTTMLPAEATRPLSPVSKDKSNGSDGVRVLIATPPKTGAPSVVVIDAITSSSSNALRDDLVPPKPHHITTADDDDDDLELSSASSSSSDDDSANKNSSGRQLKSVGGSSCSSNASRTRSSGPFGSQPGSAYGSPVSSDPKRRQSLMTQELLHQAQQEQKKLQAMGSEDVVAPVAVPSHTRTYTSPSGPDHDTNLGRTPSENRGSSFSRSASTSSSSYITNPMKRQSIADIRKALAIGGGTPEDDNTSTAGGGGGLRRSPSGGTSTMSARTHGTEEAKLGNVKARKFATEVRDAMITFRKETGVGGTEKRSIGDAAFEEIRKAREILEAIKQQAAAELTQAAKHGALLVDAQDIKLSILQLFDDLVAEGDKRTNGDVVAAIVHSIASIDFQSIVLARQLHVSMCAEGYAKYLNLFLGLPKVKATINAAQAQQLLQLAAAHPVNRVDLLTAVFRHVPHCPAAPSFMKNLTYAFQDAFEQAVSRSKAGPMEDRTRRHELIAEAIRCENLINFGSKDGGDKQTIFSRAAREGDVELVTVILNNNLVEDVNRIQPDGTNALQQAAARGHHKVVEILCRLSHIAPSLAYAYPGRGTALELAMKAKVKNTEMISTLRARSIELRVISDKPSPEAASPVEPGSPASLMDRKGSKASFAKRKSLAMGADAEDEYLSVNGVVDGTNIVKLCMTAIKPTYEQIKYEESFDPTGEALRKLGTLKGDLIKAKDAMTGRLAKLEPESQIEIRKDEVRDDLLELLDKMVHESSKLPGNLQLFDTCIKRMGVSFDFLGIAVEKNWFYQAAHNGSPEFVNILLELPGCKEHNLQTFQTKLMFEGAATSTIYRVDALLNLFAHEEILNLDYFHPMLKTLWQETFVEICSLAKARPQEIRSNRMQLVKLMLDHPLVQADPEAISDDGHNVFSRACAEGDAMLVFLLLNKSKNDGDLRIKNANAATAGGLTPLMHACANGHKAVVEIFVQLVSSRPEKEQLLKFKILSVGGNAADIAAKSKKLDIVTYLKSQGLKPLIEQGV